MNSLNYRANKVHDLVTPTKISSLKPGGGLYFVVG